MTRLPALWKRLYAPIELNARRAKWYFGFGGWSVSQGSSEGKSARDLTQVVTGDPFVEQLVDAIRLRQATLVTGPRGCGKSYCVQRALEQAKQKGFIGDFVMIQGNSQLPRDYLMEDMLVADTESKLALLPAIILRRSKQDSLWPAFPVSEVTKDNDPRRKWKSPDWIVLYLDELNRFSDGFLDSLLSLMEEKIAVRRGTAYYVPVVVLATANPPGYDITAKKLSPPLQARLARSYMMVQPGLEELVQIILSGRLRTAAENELPPGFIVPVELQYRAAGVLLCMWGVMDAEERSALSYLTIETRDLILAAEARSPVLKKAMRRLSDLSSFGPDARAISDWVLAACADAVTEGSSQLTVRNLIKAAPAVLPHKVREVFNEGVEPQKAVDLRIAVIDIVVAVLGDTDFDGFFEGLNSLASDWHIGVRELDRSLEELDPDRMTPWRFGLGGVGLLLKGVLSESASRVRQSMVASKALTQGGSFFSEKEYDWVVRRIKGFAQGRGDGTAATVENLLRSWGLDAEEAQKQYQYLGEVTRETAIRISETLQLTNERPTIVHHGALRIPILALIDRLSIGKSISDSLQYFETDIHSELDKWGLSESYLPTAVSEASLWLKVWAEQLTGEDGQRVEQAAAGLAVLRTVNDEAPEEITPP